MYKPQDSAEAHALTRLLPIVGVEQWHPNDPLQVKYLRPFPDVGYNHSHLVRLQDVYAVLDFLSSRSSSSIEVLDGWSALTAQMKMSALVEGSGRGITELDHEVCVPQAESVSETQDLEPALYDLVHIGCGGVAFRYSKRLAVGDSIHPSEVTMVDGGSGLDARGGHLLCGSCGDLLVANHVRARGAGWMGVTLPIPSTPAAGEPNPGSQSRSGG